MLALAHVAKDVKLFHCGGPPVKYVSLTAENKNNSILVTCKFTYILEVFSLCFTRCKMKKYKQRQNKRKTEKQEQKEEN